MHKPLNPDEVFAGNRSINESIHEILAAFDEPSRSRMRTKIRHDRKAIDKHGTDQTDENARRTYREFVVAHHLKLAGYALEYGHSFGRLTPDWFDPVNRLVMEVVTIERGASGSLIDRIAEGIRRKVTKYRELAAELSFVVAIYGDFETFCDADDCADAIRKCDLFQTHKDLSGVVFFSETWVVAGRQ